MSFKEIRIKQNKQREIILTLTLEAEKELITHIEYKRRGLDKWLRE